MTTAKISGLASTQSRGRRPGKPVTLSHCSGVYEYTTDGRKILSWPMGQYGPLLGFPSRENQLTQELCGELFWDTTLGRASLGSYPPESEQLLADKLATLYAPYLRSPDIGIRFFSDGTAATQCAVALARYATGREAFVSVGYHGGSSPVFTTPPQDGGVLRANGEGRFDIDFGEKVEYWPDELACAVIEVPAVENELGAAHYLSNVSFDCQKYGAYFIFDDIVTGFRFSPSGGLGYYSGLIYQSIPPEGYWSTKSTLNIQADFICLGKALSTYGKVSALLGPANVMEALADKVFASYTFNDHPLGFIDALWTLGEYEKYSRRLYEEDVYEIGGELAYGVPDLGIKLKNELNELFTRYNFPAKCIGHPVRSALVPTDDSDKLHVLCSRVVDEHDILLHRPQFVTLAHDLNHVEQTLVAVESVLRSWR